MTETTAITFPHSGEDMEYKPHPTARYVLTPEYVKTMLGIDLSARGMAVGANPSAYATRMLDRASRKVYRYCLAASMDTELLRLILAKAPSCRELLRDMMLAEVEFESAGNSPFSEDKNKRISYETAELANDMIIPEIGTVLRYSGKLNLFNQHWLQGEW